MHTRQLGFGANSSPTSSRTTFKVCRGDNIQMQGIAPAFIFLIALAGKKKYKNLSLFLSLEFICYLCGIKRLCYEYCKICL